MEDKMAKSRNPLSIKESFLTIEIVDVTSKFLSRNPLSIKESFLTITN